MPYKGGSSANIWIICRIDTYPYIHRESRRSGSRDAAGEGELIGAEGEVVRAGRPLIFLLGTLRSNGRALPTHSGTIKRASKPRQLAPDQSLRIAMALASFGPDSERTYANTSATSLSGITDSE